MKYIQAFERGKDLRNKNKIRVKNERTKGTFYFR